jgi:hypothetical protein
MDVFVYNSFVYGTSKLTLIVVVKHDFSIFKGKINLGSDKNFSSINHR